MSGAILALLPADRDDDRLVSHGGLTYGGFVVGAGMHVAVMLDVFAACREYLRGCGVMEWTPQARSAHLPLQPAEEDLYALFRFGAALVRRDVGACACPARLGRWPERVAASLRKAESAGLRVAESDAMQDFWPLLEENLAARHAARPVHSLSEIERLRSLFPTEIRLFVVHRAGRVQAGAVVYETGPSPTCSTRRPRTRVGAQAPRRSWSPICSGLTSAKSGGSTTVSPQSRAAEC